VTAPTLPTEISDDLTYQVAVKALQCLQASYPVSSYAPGEYCARVGTSVTYDIDQFRDLCCDGLGYVLLGETIASSSSFPEQDIVRQANSVCAPASWAQMMTVGILRCIPVVVDDEGSMPSCDDWTLAFYQNVADIMALRRAACCLRSWFVAQTGQLEGMSIVLQPQSQGSPQGGCVERSMTIAFQIPNCDCFGQI
jgi:hypothetical protein